MIPHFENLGLDTFLVSQADLQEFPSLAHQHPPVILNLVQHKKHTTVSAFYKSKYLKIRSRYGDHEALFTDGSKAEGRAGTAIHVNAEIDISRPLDEAIVFSADLKALLPALEHISKTQNNFLRLSACITGGCDF